MATAGGSFQGKVSSGSGGYLSRGSEGTRAMGDLGRRPFEARYARMRGDGANATETDDCGVDEG
jgi:hypothetical protein